MPPAGFWRREVAWLLDALLLTAAMHLLLAVPLMLLGLGTLPSLWPLLADVQSTIDSGDPALLWEQLHVLLGWLALVLAIATAAYAVLGWLYFALLESSPWQATLGKRALGVVVTDAAGTRLRFGRASARFFAASLSWATLNLGHALAGWRRDGRALHDLVAGTRVLLQPGTAPRLPDWARVLVWLQGAVAGALLLLPLLLGLLLLALA